MFYPYGKIEVEFDNEKEKYLLDFPTKVLVVEKGC